MKKIIPAILIVSVFASCQKELSTSNPDPGNDPPNQRELLTKIEQDAHNFVMLDYNNLNQLSLFKLLNDDIGFESTVTYGADQKPLQSEMEGFILNYKYKSGKLDRVEYYTDNNIMQNFVQYAYNGGKISQTVMYTVYGEDSLAGFKVSYTYYDDGDIKTMSNYSVQGLPGKFTLDDSTAYEYDDKINPLHGPEEVFYTFYINNSSHNVSKQTVYDAEGNVQETSRYSYTYSSKGLPLTAVENTVVPGGPAENKMFRYSYK